MLEGAIRVNLENGSAEAITLEESSSRSPLPPAIQTQVDSGKISGRLHAIGDIYASTSVEDSGAGGLHLVLRRWKTSTGKALPPLVIFPKRPVAHLMSADGLHLLVADTVKGENPAWQDYRWSVFSIASGELIAETTSAFSAQPFCLLAGRILWASPAFGRRVQGEWIERPLELRGCSLESGVASWSITLHDPTYRGTLPPTR